MLEPPRNDEEDRRNPRNSHANKEVSNQESRSWNPGHILVTVSLSHAGSKGLFFCRPRISVL